VVLVGHDAGGPDAIDYAVGERGRVEQLVLLNTYYGHAPTLRLPEAIRLLADPNLTPLADAMLAGLFPPRGAAPCPGRLPLAAVGPARAGGAAAH
jgi:pimeloyl-ACP methyl ester carboxylesterase